MRLCLFMLLFFTLSFANAQRGSAKKTSAKGQTAVIATDGAMIYAQPDFDAAILTTLKVGAKVRISKGKEKTFYRVLVKPGVTGWLSDVDVQLADGSMGSDKKGPRGPKSAREDRKKSEKNKKPYYLSRFIGVQMMSVNFREDTLARKPRESLSFYGMKMTGSNVLIEGDVPSEINILIHSGAPGYYDEITGVPMTGFIFLGDLQLMTPFLLGDDHMVHVGFGPLLRYTKFETSVAGKALSLQDINLGVVLTLEAGFRVGSVSLRGEYKYFWEKQAYSGLGVSAQFEF